MGRPPSCHCPCGSYLPPEYCCYSSFGNQNSTLVREDEDYDIAIPIDICRSNGYIRSEQSYSITGERYSEKVRTRYPQTLEYFNQNKCTGYRPIISGFFKNDHCSNQAFFEGNWKQAEIVDAELRTKINPDPNATGFYLYSTKELDDSQTYETYHITNTQNVSQITPDIDLSDFSKASGIRYIIKADVSGINVGLDPDYSDSGIYPYSSCYDCSDLALEASHRGHLNRIAPISGFFDIGVPFSPQGPFFKDFNPSTNNNPYYLHYVASGYFPTDRFGHVGIIADFGSSHVGVRRFGDRMTMPLLLNVGFSCCCSGDAWQIVRGSIPLNRITDYLCTDREDTCYRMSISVVDNTEYEIYDHVHDPPTWRHLSNGYIKQSKPLYNWGVNFYSSSSAASAAVSAHRNNINAVPLTSRFANFPYLSYFTNLYYDYLSNARTSYFNSTYIEDIGFSGDSSRIYCSNSHFGYSAYEWYLYMTGGTCSTYMTTVRIPTNWSPDMLAPSGDDDCCQRFHSAYYDLNNESGILRGIHLEPNKPEYTFDVDFDIQGSISVGVGAYEGFGPPRDEQGDSYCEDLQTPYSASGLQCAGITKALMYLICSDGIGALRDDTCNSLSTHLDPDATIRMVSFPDITLSSSYLHHLASGDCADCVNFIDCEGYWDSWRDGNIAYSGIPDYCKGHRGGQWTGGYDTEVANIDGNDAGDGCLIGNIGTNWIKNIGRYFGQDSDYTGGYQDFFGVNRPSKLLPSDCDCPNWNLNKDKQKSYTITAFEFDVTQENFDIIAAYQCSRRKNKQRYWFSEFFNRFYFGEDQCTPINAFAALLIRDLGATPVEVDTSFKDVGPNDNNNFFHGYWPLGSGDDRIYQWYAPRCRTRRDVAFFSPSDFGVSGSWIRGSLEDYDAQEGIAYFTVNDTNILNDDGIIDESLFCDACGTCADECILPTNGSVYTAIYLDEEPDPNSDTSNLLIENPEFVCKNVIDLEGWSFSGRQKNWPNDCSLPNDGADDISGCMRCSDVTARIVFDPSVTQAECANSSGTYTTESRFRSIYAGKLFDNRTAREAMCRDCQTQIYSSSSQGYQYSIIESGKTPNEDWITNPFDAGKLYGTNCNSQGYEYSWTSFDLFLPSGRTLLLTSQTTGYQSSDGGSTIMVRGEYGGIAHAATYLDNSSFVDSCCTNPPDDICGCVKYACDSDSFYSAQDQCVTITVARSWNEGILGTNPDLEVKNGLPPDYCYRGCPNYNSSPFGHSSTDCGENTPSHSQRTFYSRTCDCVDRDCNDCDFSTTCIGTYTNGVWAVTNSGLSNCGWLWNFSNGEFIKSQHNCTCGCEGVDNEAADGSWHQGELTWLEELGDAVVTFNTTCDNLDPPYCYNGVTDIVVVESGNGGVDGGDDLGGGGGGDPGDGDPIDPV